jgi:hypothetical protein
MLHIASSSSSLEPQQALPFRTVAQVLGPTVDPEEYSTSITSDMMLSGHLERRASAQELLFTFLVCRIGFISVKAVN